MCFVKRASERNKKKYFVSLAYSERKLFLESSHVLPEWIEPHIFPAKDVSASEMASSYIIDSIRLLDGLVYLISPESKKSFWVTFEKDYALRLHKPVYSFDPVNKIFKRDKSHYLELPIFPTYSRLDKDIVFQIFKILEERNLNLFKDWENLTVGDNFASIIQSEINKRLEKGGYTVFFGSEATYRSRWVKHELETTIQSYPDRCIVCYIDSHGLPNDFLQLELLQYKPIELARFGQIDKHKLDDLIVRLYWHIYQNQKAYNKSLDYFSIGRFSIKRLAQAWQKLAMWNKFRQ